MAKLSMRELLEAGAHFGHQTRYWNPKMGKHIFGARNKIHIINLEHTLPMFNDSLNFVSKIAAKRGNIMFVGTKRSARGAIREEAEKCGMPFVSHRWLGGMLTNFRTVRQSIRRLKTLEKGHTDGTFEKLVKKEILLHTREQEKLERTLGGIKNMKGLPDALFIVDVGHEKIAVQEAKKLGIPVIAIVDTNDDPGIVDYPIPANDDAFRAIRLYTSAIAEAVLEGRASITTGVGAERGAEEEGKPAAKPKKKASKKAGTKKTETAAKPASKKAASKKASKKVEAAKEEAPAADKAAE